MSKQAIGKMGEKLAEEYFSSLGWCVIGKNIRTPFGEIDLIIQKDNLMIFIEVKTRSNRKFGFPEMAITAKKKTHLLESANYYLSKITNPQGDWRIDVLAIQIMGEKKYQFDWFENVIS